MRTVNNFQIGKESLEDQCKAGRWNPALEITFRDRHGQHRHKLGAGYSDDIHVFREHGLTFIVGTNSRLGYVSLEVYEGKDKLGEVFLEYHNLQEALGKTDLKPITLAKRLKDYAIL